MSTRIYMVEGRKVTFNKKIFKYLLVQKANRAGISKTKMEQELAEQLGVAWNTVHKWNGTGGGPIDYETIEKMAGLLDVTDPTLLLVDDDKARKKMCCRNVSSMQPNEFMMLILYI